MKTHASLPALLLAGALAFPLPGLANAEPTATAIRFTDPNGARTLRISLGRGDVHLRGTAAPEVTVTSESTPVSPKPRADGLRVLTTSSGFSLTEKNNLVVLDAAADGWTGGSPVFRVDVPAGVNVVINNALGGNITCADVRGDLEVKSMNGEIRLEDVRGGALVETMNGEISATVREVQDGKPVSFTSINGEITIRVPEDLRARVRFRSQNGSILTDFDDKALVTRTEALGRSHRAARIAVKSGGSESEIQAAVRDAVREGVDAAREAANAVRAAAIAARDAAREAGDPGADGNPPIPPPAPLPPMTGGKIVSGTLNGGGKVEIQAATMNGDLTLRKLAK